MDELNGLPTHGGMYEYRDGKMVAIEGGPPVAPSEPDPAADGNGDQPTGEPA